MTSKTADTFVMPFGKYKNMLLADIDKISIIKDGKTKNVGHQYLVWLSKQDWFHQCDFIKKIIGEEEVTTEPIKKEPKKKQTVKITTDEKLEFQ